MFICSWILFSGIVDDDVMSWILNTDVFDMFGRFYGCFCRKCVHIRQRFRKRFMLAAKILCCILLIQVSNGAFLSPELVHNYRVHSSLIPGMFTGNYYKVLTSFLCRVITQTLQHRFLKHTTAWKPSGETLTFIILVIEQT